MARGKRKGKKKQTKGKSHGCGLFLLVLLLLGAGAGFWGNSHRSQARAILKEAEKLAVQLVDKAKAASEEKPAEARETPAPPPVEQPAPKPLEGRLAEAKAVSVAKRASKYDNLAFGVPGPADTIIDREGYALGYIEYHEQPSWVTYRLTKEEVLNKAVKRGKDFREDPDIPTGSATLEDYRNSGYDRGHLAPSGDMTWSAKANSESFYMSNMSPQERAFNGGLWNKLEEWVRNTAVREGEIQVVTGPILPKVKTKTIGANKVTVPDYYYKVILDLTPPCKAIGFIMPNQHQKKPLGVFAVTVDEVERQTGLDFFSEYPQPEQEKLESQLNKKAWGLQ